MNVADTPLLPRARLRDVFEGTARLIGSRCDAGKPRGWLSPIEARLRMGIPYGDLRREEADYLTRRTLKTDLGVVARTLFASMLTPSRKARAEQRPFVVSASIDNLTINEAVELILGVPEPGRARLVYFVHAHALNLARFDREYARLLAEADARLPDGIGIRLAARALGIGMRHNLNGTDLFPILCREAAARKIPVVLIGGKPGIAAECGRRMCLEVPTVDVAFTCSGYFASDIQAWAAAAAVRRLGRSLVLVGMGSPMQERWAAAHLRNCPGATVLTVGGLFDFYSGRVRRAPVFWRETGMEWVYRLLQEPRRLAKRYLVGNPLFLTLALMQRVGLIGRKARAAAAAPNVQHSTFNIER
jgi:N-acetylglucosaminyldiphosphoundecaprenol N-acetyl-beta-D-mannosaminyltransferase